MSCLTLLPCINKKLSCCCDRRSYCMQKCNRLKTDYCVISILTLFIVTAASWPVNKNVTTGAVIRAKRGTERAFINYWRTIKPVVTSLGLWTARTELRIAAFRLWTHSLNSLKRYHERPCRSTVSNCVVVKKNSRSHLLRLFFVVRFVAKRHILQQKCPKGQIETCLL